MLRKPRIHYTETDKALMWDNYFIICVNGKSLQKRYLQPMDCLYNPPFS